MKIIDGRCLQDKIDTIVKEYLYMISYFSNNNHFLKQEPTTYQAKYYHSRGFSVLFDNHDNDYIVKEEQTLEGCTRVFLVNKIIKKLLKLYNIESDWCFGDDFNNATLSNRDYEKESYLEFIIQYNGKNIGCRYIPTLYSLSESSLIEQDFAFRCKQKPIPGFKKLSTIDEIWDIDWSGISDNELSSIRKDHPHEKHTPKAISISCFFKKLFNDKIYELFFNSARSAIDEAQKIIALKAVPQLLPNNMLMFKQLILEDFSETNILARKYQFKNGNHLVLAQLSTDDIDLINDTFLHRNRRLSIIGSADFAKSFITSEYLFKTTNNTLGIDYTSVVVGYLKSVEQLLYLLYVSAFEGNTSLEYWDYCGKNNSKNFDIALPKFRIDPYNPEKKQILFSHKLKIGDGAMDFGRLAQFLRYYSKMWNISETGKEYIFACLDDYRESCRNSHFHKINIEYKEYDIVKRIRSNAMVLLYYLLGAFELLDNQTPVHTQLGITDYSFEYLYQTIWQRHRKIFWTKIKDGYEGIICYLNRGPLATYDEIGRLQYPELHFVKFSGLNRDTAIAADIEVLFNNAEHVKNNTIVINRETTIEIIEPFIPKRKK